MAINEDPIPQIEETKLYNDVCSIIDDTRYRVAVYVNSETCHLNWHIGMRIKEDVLHNTRAEYGKQVIKNLAKNLSADTVVDGDSRNSNIVYALRILFQKMRLTTQCVVN